MRHGLLAKMSVTLLCHSKMSIHSYQNNNLARKSFTYSLEIIIVS